ncbi:hypothetical protein LMJF_31_2040 [Leishmania major strain Friedlin]|uniref:Uncharacterized protein n=1 Tax=Leishmania major TaxID=5664 RepID=Q4Q658_LEIMA|nr:hypothetical protein LMJF_31_2040 [Leishmania major strain Friedlin]CAG9579379.1 hypothetical_protein_-_conserved [Leishmania major strain Friedlin]CAJ08392.1 hypothetical protein LMJF_31_2040 [Leishmania major strain Friedlin]|eukprot:XP_001685190.1 hypothetical protein LMJF_31_2040 [Leishmania major strain Friedlin]
MPLYAPLGIRFSDDVNERARLERQRIARLNNILRHGSDEQRRQALKMKPLPLPGDPEALAVSGTAVLDLPGDADECLDPHNETGVFDPLDAVAQRYGGAQYNDDDRRAAERGVDYSVFMEVLCPNGSSLLESLPLEPRTPPQHLKGLRGESKISQFESALSSPRCGLRTRLPSTAVAAAMPEASLSLGHNAFVARGPPSASFVNTSTVSEASVQSGLDETYVDAPVTLGSEAASLRASSAENGFATSTHGVADPASDAARATAATHAEDDDTTPGVFVSAGSFSLAASHRSSRWHSLLSFRRSPSGSSKASHTDSGHRNARGVAHLSLTRSLSQRALKSSSELSLPTSGATSAQLTPLAATDGCDLGGRVIFTDRFVKAQSHTALPTMISAFKQYMRSASSTAACSSPAHSQTLDIYTPSEHWSFLQHQQLQNAHQYLGPCHRGIPLKSDNTNKEIENCVLEAGQCIRPTFRRMDPAELYGTSHYISSAFIKVTKQSTNI